MFTSERQGPATRWVHEPMGSGVDAELGQVFREAEQEEPFSDAELVRVGRRLRAGSRRRRSWLRAVPVMLAVLTGGSGAALAQWLRPGIWDGFGWPRAEQASTPRAVLGGPAARREPPVAVAPVRPEPAAQAIAAEPLAQPAPSAPPGEARPARDVTLESELLQRALERLRREHDGAAALRLLDEHRARFPGGVLALEAAVARVDALLLLGRRGEALEQLAGLPLSRVGRRTELQLLRAELRAERDCRKALDDFDAVLAAAPPPNLAERALYGRATCRLRVGDERAGRADLEAYLQRFPDGRFAQQIRGRFEQ